jgi:hypothetical protein
MCNKCRRNPCLCCKLCGKVCTPIEHAYKVADVSRTMRDNAVSGMVFCRNGEWNPKRTGFIGIRGV